MRKTFAMVTVLLAAGLAFAAAETNQKVIAQAPVLVACTDAGTVSYNPDPEVVRFDVWNSAAIDVCVAYCGADCTAQAPDRTSVTTCSIILGAYGGAGTADVVSFPGATLDVERDRAATAAFECDSNGTANLVVTEYKRVR